MKKNIVNRFALAFILVACTAFLYAGGKKDSQNIQENVVPAESGSVVRLGVLNGPTGMPAAYLLDNKPDLGGADLDVSLFSSASLELPKLIKGEIDVGFLPVNVASKVFTSGGGAVIALGIGGYGNVYLISTDESCSSVEDLKGKTVSCAGQGATPEYMFRYILSKHGIDTGDSESSVNLDFSTPNADIAAALISGKFSYAVVPEPFATVATVKEPSVKRVMNLSDEWKSFEGTENYPLTLLVANAKFAEENKETLNLFIDAYKEAVDWTVANPNKAGVLVQKYTLGLLAPVAAKAIPNAAFTWVDAADGRTQIEQLVSVYLSFAPEAVGGALPADGFYYSK